MDFKIHFISEVFILLRLESKGNKFFDNAVECCLGNKSGKHSFFDRVVVSSVLRHIEIISGKKGLNAVLDTAPVGHDNAFEPPFIPEDIRQHSLVLRHLNTVDWIVTGHERPGL